MMQGGGWSTHQLAELLAVVSSFEDEERATVGALERAAEFLEADAAAVVLERRVAATVGFPAGEVPHGHILAVASGAEAMLAVPGLGECHTNCTSLDDYRTGRLLLARREEGFSREDANVAGAMGRVIALTLDKLRILERERALRAQSERQTAERARLVLRLEERQALLERLARIQRSIVSRADREAILEAIVQGAAELLGDEVVALRLIDTGNPSVTSIAASRGIDPELLKEIRRENAGAGVGGSAIAEDRLVIADDYEHAENVLPALVRQRLQAAMAAPVREKGRVVGSLVVATYRPGRRYSADEQEMLLAFAEHASIALTDARMVDESIQQALHDPLTGLPNRTLLLDRLDAALARAERRRASVAVLFLDLDRFKRVNDSHGHAAGDELLVAVAGRLHECVRPGDTVARLSGDEFAVLLEEPNEGEVPTAVAKRILEALQRPFAISGRSVVVEGSLGIAVGHSRGEDLLRNADLAMYRAKGRGRGQFEVFKDQMYAELAERLTLEEDLQEAKGRGELTLDYQPVVELATGEAIGVEALLRWRHPTRGLVPPSEFIPLAEEASLIVALGRWGLVEACRQAAAWQVVRPGLRMSVNMSGAQFEHPDMVDEVAAALRRSGLAPDHLLLEITESVLMHDTKVTLERLRRLKRLGLQLAIDDFGTGYSSLRYLRQFPIDVLKIDKSFVAGLGREEHESAVVRAVIELGEGFGVGVVAEGIESAEQAEQLLALGCQLGQGYHFSPPTSREGVEALLAGDRALDRAAY